MKYHVTIGEGGREYEVIVDGDDITIDGQRMRAHLDDAGQGIHTLVLDGRTHTVVSRRGEEKGSFDLSIGGHRFHAEALDARARAIRQLAGIGGRTAAPAHLMAPMPGLVVRVHVAAGDEVQPGQGLVVMEAMKMENELRAVAAGRVKRVAVAPGSAVEKGALLLEME